MTLRDDLLDDIDEIREIPGEIGLRLFTVQVFKRVWSGDRPGLGTDTDTITSVLIGTFNPKVTQVSSRDVIASAGQYQDQDLRIGPITPSKVDVPIFDPPVGVQPMEVFFKLVGPGYESGAYFRKINQLTTRPFRYEFVVRADATLRE